MYVLWEIHYEKVKKRIISDVSAVRGKQMSEGERESATIQITCKTINNFICSVFAFGQYNEGFGQTLNDFHLFEIERERKEMCMCEYRGVLSWKLDDAELRYDIYMGDVYANRFHVPNNVSSVWRFCFLHFFRLMTVEK